MITKFTIVCLCMTASTMMGLLYTKNKKRRMLYFDSCVKLTDILISDISFKKSNLFVIIKSYAETDKTELKTHITKFCESPYQRFVPESKILKPDEIILLSDFFSSLGEADSQTQLFELENYKQRFNSIYIDESEKFKKDGSIGLKLSVLFGLAVGILIL